MCLFFLLTSARAVRCVVVSRQNAERTEEILREHGRVPVQPRPVQEDGGAGRVQSVPRRVRAGETPKYAKHAGNGNENTEEK